MAQPGGILWGGRVFDAVLPSLEEREAEVIAHVHAEVDRMQPGDSLRIERHDPNDAGDGRLFTLTAGESGARTVIHDPSVTNETHSHHPLASGEGS